MLNPSDFSAAAATSHIEHPMTNVKKSQEVLLAFQTEKQGNNQMIIRNASEFSDSGGLAGVSGGVGRDTVTTAAHLTRTSHKKGKNNKDSSNFNDIEEKQQYKFHQAVV